MNLTDEQVERLNLYVKRRLSQQKIEQRQLERLHESNKFVEILEKVLIKYNSTEYVEKWYNKGIFPPEDLLFFLYDYVKLYGRDCSDEEYDTYGNDFTTCLLFHEGYYFNKVVGQGCFIDVIKK